MSIKRRRHYRRHQSFKWVILCGMIAVGLLVLIFIFLLVSSLTEGSNTPQGGGQTTQTTEPTTAEDNGGIIEENGFPVSAGWFILNDKAYYGADEGKLFVGNHVIDGVAYTFADDGSLLNGWMQMGNLRYHFKDGVMSKGTTEIDGRVYHINSDGSMFVGWYEAANGYVLYYDTETGEAYIGWHEIEGKHYCFDGAGFLYKNTTADGVAVDENGVANEEQYQKLIAGSSTTAPTVNTTQSGAVTTAKTVDMVALNKKLDDILAKHGKSPRNIYDYVHDNYTYKHAVEGTIEENALYLLENGTGSCYHFASLTYMLFQRAGFETRYVTGLGWQNHTYHCWIMAKFDGGWYYVDSLYVRSAKLTAADLKRIGYEWDESAYPS